MAQQTINVEQLTGQARNPVAGQMAGGITPYRVFNLVPDRMGGYAPFGRRARVLDGDGFQIELANLPYMVGFDETGVSSYRVGALTGDFELYWGPTLTQRRTPVTISANEERAVVHLDAAGAYVNRSNYFVFEQKHRDRAYRIAVEPISGAAPIVAATTGLAFQNEPATWNVPVVDAAYGDGVYVVATEIELYRRSGPSGAWTQVVNLSGDYLARFLRVVYGGGTWMALMESGGLASVYVSTDNGLTWAPHTVNAANPTRRVMGLAYGAGVWVATGTAMWRSTNTGTSWALVDGNEGGTWEVKDAAYAADMGHWLAPVWNDTDAPVVWAKHVLYSDNGGASWVTTQMISPGVGSPSQVSNYAYRVVTVAGGFLRFIHGNGNDTNISFTLPGAWYSFAAGAPLPGVSGTDAVNGVVHDPVGGFTIVVGDSGGAPRIWRSQDSGWQRLTDIENAFVTAGDTTVGAVAIDEDGNVSYFGTHLTVFTGASAGFRAGAYNVIALSYFNTHAGRFVFNIARGATAVEEGGGVTITLPSKDSIIANNDWLSLYPDSQPLVDDLRCDIYIQRSGDVIEGEEVQYTIRYAFTKPYPQSASESHTISDLPLGQQLLLHGYPTTAIFEQSRTAIHNGRIWGMASQDEGLWRRQDASHARGDEMSYEIANQANRFVLCYTEIGWANLMSDRSYIPIQPTQSSRFTGLVSTPSGLLVMFENEIFLINGDPAFGNVNVELYLDLVGCDDGTEPCKVGGVPFVIWNGKVWVLQAGQAQQIGAEQWRADDPFVGIAPEPQSRSLLARTKAGQVFRYLLDDQFWLTDAVSAVGGPVAQMLPNCTCESNHNTRFVVEDPTSTYRVWATRRDGTPDAPHLTYLGMDFGALERRKALYLVKAGFEGAVMRAEYDREAMAFDADAVPTLLYQAANEGNGVVTAVTEQPGGILPYRRASGSNTSGTLAWRLPLRRTRGDSIDVRLELRGLDYGDVLKLPLRFVVAGGGELR